MSNKPEIISVYEVTDFNTNKRWLEYLFGYGQGPIRSLRKEYPRFTKFVLEGFEINGTFVELKMRR